MKRPLRTTAIIEREDDGFVSLCPEPDIASQGATIEEAHSHLVEALTLFFEAASPSEVGQRLHLATHG
jgi:predicted RNase H-like HicB family nuclease